LTWLAATSSAIPSPTLASFIRFYQIDLDLSMSKKQLSVLGKMRFERT